MRAIRIHQPGGPDAIRLDELEAPAPGEGEALVEVEAAGVNFIDVYQRTGRYPAPLPLALGLEGAGTVRAVGPAARLAPGDRVAWASAQGSYATHLIARTDRLVRVPDEVDTRTAAAAMLQGMTAHYLTTSTFPLAEGHTCVVHAAAGGVGLLLCQLGKRAGARVIGTCGSERKAELARRAGATDVVVYTEADFSAEVMRLTDGRGADVIYDSVGAQTFERGLDCLAPRGMMVLFGQSSGPAPAVDPQALGHKGSLFLTRPSLFHYIATREALEARARELFAWIAAGELSIAIWRTLELERAAEAHRLLEARQTSGKLLLIP
jgi:NADPH:quinone reductase